jgi:hypothetical protein
MRGFERFLAGIFGVKDKPCACFRAAAFVVGQIQCPRRMKFASARLRDHTVIEAFAHSLLLSLLGRQLRDGMEPARASGGSERIVGDVHLFRLRMQHHHHGRIRRRFPRHIFDFATGCKPGRLRALHI